MPLTEKVSHNVNYHSFQRNKQRARLSRY